MDPIVIILGLVAAFIVGSLIYKFFIKKPSIKIEPEVVSREPVVKDSIRYSTQSNSLRSSSRNHLAKQDQLSRAIDANDLLAAAVVSSSLMSDDDSSSRSTRSYSSDYDSDSRSSYSGSSSSNYSSSSYDSGSSSSSSSDSSSSSSSGGSD